MIIYDNYVKGKNGLSCGIVYSEEYLEHHGILGQKWGLRRFQNKDGSLTEAGKKRRVKDMSDDELREKTYRLQREKAYYDAKNEAKKAEKFSKKLDAEKDEKQESGASKVLKKYAARTFENVILPAAESAGKEYLEKQLKKMARESGMSEKEKKIRKELAKMDLEELYVQRRMDRDDGYKFVSRVAINQMAKSKEGVKALGKLVDYDKELRKAADKRKKEAEPDKWVEKTNKANTKSNYYQAKGNELKNKMYYEEQKRKSSESKNKDK